MAWTDRKELEGCAAASVIGSGLDEKLGWVELGRLESELSEYAGREAEIGIEIDRVGVMHHKAGLERLPSSQMLHVMQGTEHICPTSTSTGS